MTITERRKFWLVFSLIVIAGFIGGILGNWMFIYLLDKYYNIPGGNYLAAPVTGDVVIRDQKPAAGSGDFAQAVKNADASLVGLFRYDAAKSATDNFLPQNQIGQAAVLTSDGWLVSATRFAADAKIDSFRIVANDRKAYAINKIVFDAPSQLTFIRLADAQSLPVKEFLMSRDLNAGQTIVGIEWNGTVEEGHLSRGTESVRMSDTFSVPLSVSGLSDHNLFLFDTSGRMVGLTRGRTILAMDSIKRLTDKLLTANTIDRASLGVRYLNLSALPVTGPSGVLLVADGSESAVAANSAAARAGLRAGDIITSFDGVEVGTFSSLGLLVQEYDPGDRVSIAFMRNGAPLTADVTLDRLTLK